MSGELHSGLFLVFPILLAVAAISDLMTMTISNRLCALVVVGFAFAALALGLPWAAVGMSVAVASLVLAIGFTCFAFGWMGGGDAKLAAAATLWLGIGGLLPFLLYVAVFGGVLTFGLLAFRSLILPRFALKEEWISRLHDSKAGVPYGIAIAAAAMVVFPETPFLGLVLGAT